MRRGTTLLACGVSGAFILHPAAFAAEWDRGAGIAVGGYYTDNVCLSTRDKEDKWVGTVRPNVSIQGQGARGNVSLRAAADYNSLSDSDLDCETGRGNQFSNRESVIPRVTFHSDYELVQDWLVVLADASARRNAANPFAPGAESGFGDRDNTNITYDYTVGALLQRRLAQTANLLMRYSYNEQFNNSGAYGDSSEDRAEFGLDTIPGAARLSVGVGGRYSKIHYDRNDLQDEFDNELSSAEFRAGLQLTSSWQLNGLAGEEWNEFNSANPDIDGSYWDVGLRWTPNSRIEVGAGYGERFFGSTPRANISYRHKRSTLAASYARSVSIPRNLRVGDSGFVEPEGPLDTGSGEVPDLIGLPTFVGNSPVVDERLEIRYNFAARRSSFSVFGSESRQRRVEDEADATFRSAGIRFTRNLSSVLSANLNLNWSEREGRGGTIGPEGEITEIWRTGFGFSRRVGNDTTFTVGYAFVSSESDFARNDYDENRVTFNVRHAF